MEKPEQREAEANLTQAQEPQQRRVGGARKRQMRAAQEGKLAPVWP